MSDLTPSHDFAELSQLIEERRGRVARLVNTELIDLYWELGKRIELRISAHGWGRGTVTELADYLSSHTQGLRGFSSSNLWRMRQFYETWKNAPEKLAPLLREWSWSAHLDLLGRCKTHEERQFKDSYVLDFLDLPEDQSEADLHQGLIRNLSKSLSEPGRDFCFIGSEHPLQVGNQDFAVDLIEWKEEETTPCDSASSKLEGRDKLKVIGLDAKETDKALSKNFKQLGI